MMEQVLTCLIGPQEWARSVAKENSDTSFSVLALKKDEKVVNIVHPSKYPEKIWSLLFPLSLGNSIYLYIDKLDRDLGETLIALDLMGKKEGKVFLDKDLDKSAFSKFIKGNVVEGYGSFDGNPAIFREELFSLKPVEPSGPPMVVVDQAFNVRGVGTVALGFVISGEVRIHQEMVVHPTGLKAQIRSIQVQDRDFGSAPAGSRVGLALKNVSENDLKRGYCLTSTDASLRSSDRLELRLRTSRFWKDEIKKGDRYHLIGSLQMEPCTVLDVSKLEEKDQTTYKVLLSLDSPVWSAVPQMFGLVHLDSRSFRFFGAGETI